MEDDYERQVQIMEKSRKSTTEDWMSLLEAEGIQLVDSYTPEQRETVKCEAHKIADAVEKKMADVIEMWSDLNIIHDIEKGPVNPSHSEKDTFRGRHGWAKSILMRKPNYLLNLFVMDDEQKTKAVEADRECRKAAFNLIFNGIEPPEEIARSITLKHKYYPEKEYAQLTEREKLHYLLGENTIVSSRPELGELEPFTFMDGKGEFLEECQKARIIKRAYDYVMKIGSLDDKEEAQEMMDVYSSLHSDDKSKVLNYAPHEKREIPEALFCSASKEDFSPSKLVYIKVRKDWVTKREGNGKAFWSVRLPNDFKIDGKVTKFLSYATSLEDASEITEKDGCIYFGYHYSRNISIEQYQGKNQETGKWVYETFRLMNVRELSKCISDYEKSTTRAKSNTGKGL